MPILLPLVIATALVCSLWLRNVVKPGWTTRRNLPHPLQPFWLFRLFHEPDGFALERFSKDVQHDGIIRYFGILNEERIFAVSPEATKDLLGSGTYKVIKPPLQAQLVNNVAATGLTFREGQEHKRFRRHLQPAFKASRIKEAYPIAWECAESSVERIVGRLEHEKVRVLQDIQAMTLETIGKWAFSTELGSLQRPQSRFSRLYTGLFRATEHGTRALTLGTIVGPRLLMLLPLRATRTMSYVASLIREKVDHIVRDREMEQQKGCQEKRRGDMLDTLLASGELSHQDIVEESVHFLAAASEMPTVLVAWVVHLLSRYPGAQDRLRKELRDHFAVSRTADELAVSRTADELSQLPYLSAVLDETLRLHHPDTVLWRQAAHPLNLAGTLVDPGVKIVWSPFVLSRNKEYWGEDADVFRPERWLEEHAADGKRFAGHFSYINYGLGPRRCIGELYGKAVSQCMVAGIVRRIAFAPVDIVSSTDDGVEIATCPPISFFKILDGWEIQAKVV